MAKLHTVVYLALITLFHAEASATEGSIQLLENRAAYYGGFSLSIDLETNCPASTFSCDYSTGPIRGGPCCPTHTVCTANGIFCCPTSTDCSDTVSNAPACADPKWTLFSDGDVTFVCCPSGMVVDQAMECVTPGATGYSSQVPEYTSEVQSNNASPTGDGTGTAFATAAATTDAGADGTAWATASASTPTGSGGSTSTSTGASASATKKSAAEKKFAAGGALAGAIAMLHLLL